MSNEQTTQQWTQAAASIDAQIAQIEQQIDTAAQQQQANSAQITQLRRQLNSLPLGSAERAAIDRQMVALSDQNNQLSADQAQLSAKLSPLEISLNNATTQATASRSGPPNTSVVPPPATTATTIATTQLVNETPPAAPPKLTVSEQPTTTDTGSPPVQESVFDPRQEPAESVFDPGPTYNGPATEESVFDPRQDVGENVFDPDSAVPSAAVADAAARINDPYYGLTPEQLKALGGADPTDPYIRARLGIPQLAGSTLNPGGFAAYQPTGVPLIDNAVAAISSFASSLTSFFSPPTKPAVTATGTTTGAPAPSGTDTDAAAAEATAVKQQSSNLTPTQQANLTNIQAANAEVSKAEENIQANNRTILAAEEGVATARETQRNAEAIIAQNNAELADENLPDDRRAQLEANNVEQYSSIAENARYIDETTAAIENAEQNNQQQQRFIQENQTSVEQSQQAFAADNSDLDAPVDPMEDPEYNNYDTPAYDAATDGPVNTGDENVFDPRQDPAESVFDPGDAGPATAAPGEPGGAPLLTDAEIATIYGTTDPQEVGAIQGTTIISDEARAALSDPETIKAQQAQNQFALENPATVPEVTTTELTDAEAAGLFEEAEAEPPPTEDVPVDAEQDPEIAAADAAVAAPLEANPEATIPDDVPPEEDPGLEELEEPPGTEGEITDLAEPVDPESDPELLAGEEEEPFTELAEPPDPDATPELEQLAGEEELEPYTELAEPPTDEPEQLGDPELEDGEITDLAEPVDPDADPELEQLGDPALQEEADAEPEQLSGPPNVDTAEDQGLNPGGLSDEELLARQNPGGLSDEEILARQQAAQESADKANAINQATLQSRYKQPGNSDWRVRLSLAQSSDYLYNVVGNATSDTGPGILAPLAASNGVIFPYMPQISTMYRANYEQYDLVHSNFRGVYYKSSRVDDIQIRGTFTAQDTTEAAYLLATIHFFRSVTKMFYGKDPQRGTPPPLVYLSGLGDYQFSKHPCLVSQFSYTLPNDVDYIRATNVNDYGGNLLSRRAPVQSAPGGINFAGARRLANTITASGPLTKGATPQTPQNNSIVGRVNNTGDFSTYVPTMMEIDITLIPVQTRSQVSKQFSLKDFANGNLLRKGFW